MTLILTDGFETYNSGTMTNGPTSKWTTGSFDQFGTNAKSGVVAVRLLSASKRVDVADEHAKFIGGMAHMPGYNQDQQLMGFYSDNGATNHVNMMRRVGGAMSIRVGTTVVATTPSSVIDGNWHYFEMVATLADSGGTINVYMDSNPTPILSYTGDTKNGGTKTVFDTFWVQGPQYQWTDDVYLANGAGPAPYNDRLGEVRIFPLRPNGNGAVNQAVGSDGDSVNNYLHIDENPYQASASDYNQILTDGEIDLYALADLPVTTGQIASVEVAHIAAKTDAGPKSIRSVVRTNGSNFGGTDSALATNSYTPHRNTWRTNPDTGLPWTIAEINALQAGWEARP